MYAIIDFIKTLEKFKFGEFYFEVLKSAEFFSTKMGWMLYLDMNPKAFCSAPPPSEKVFFLLCSIRFIDDGGGCTYVLSGDNKLLSVRKVEKHESSSLVVRWWPFVWVLQVEI